MKTLTELLQHFNAHHCPDDLTIIRKLILQPIKEQLEQTFPEYSWAIIPQHRNEVNFCFFDQDTAFPPMDLRHITLVLLEYQGRLEIFCKPAKQHHIPYLDDLNTDNTWAIRLLSYDDLLLLHSRNYPFLPPKKTSNQPNIAAIPNKEVRLATISDQTKHKASIPSLWFTAKLSNYGFRPSSHVYIQAEEGLLTLSTQPFPESIPPKKMYKAKIRRPINCRSPHIRIAGQWMEKYYFFTSNDVRIEIAYEQIIITVIPGISPMTRNLSQQIIQWKTEVERDGRRRSHNPPYLFRY